MKTSSILAGLLLACACGLAQADGPSVPWYLGAGWGHASFSDGSSNAATVAGAAGTTVTSVKDKDNSAYKLFAGVRLNPNFAAEAGYVNLGKMSASFADGSSASVKAKGWQFNGLAILPFGDSFELFGKLGTVRAEATLDATSVAGQSDSHWKANYGIGLGYSINHHFGVRGELERYKNIGDATTTGRTDIDLGSVSAIYKF